MTSEDQWTSQHYNELIEEYAGRWVLIKNNEVIFADRQFEVVYNKSKTLCLTPKECIIRRIDSGDAVFYAFKFSIPKD